jgi:hypothetical protein
MFGHAKLCEPKCPTSALLVIAHVWDNVDELSLNNLLELKCILLYIDG